MISRRAFTSLVAGGIATFPSISSAQELSMLDAHRALVFGTEVKYLEALDVISKRGRQDMIAGLILGLRFSRMPAAPLIKVLKQLTGDNSIGQWSRWGDWMLWQEAILK